MGAFAKGTKGTSTNDLESDVASGLVRYVPGWAGTRVPLSKMRMTVPADPGHHPSPARPPARLPVHPSLRMQPVPLPSTRRNAECSSADLDWKTKRDLRNNIMVVLLLRSAAIHAP
jgi:hypothetical protein